MNSRIAKVYGFAQGRDRERGHGGEDRDHDRDRDLKTISYTYLADQDKILLAKDARGEVSLYVDGPGIDDHLGEISHHHARGYVKDHEGSIMNSAATGGIALYSAFGESVGFRRDLDSLKAPVVYGFAGMQLDPESGMYHTKNRSYLPSIGRWLSRDPIGFGGQDINLYRYVKNSPLRFTDPLGLELFNPTNGPGVPNSCGATPVQIFFEPIESSKTPVIFGFGPTDNPDAPGSYGGTYGSVNTTSTVQRTAWVNVDINSTMNRDPQTLDNTLIHEGTHVLGSPDSVAYPLSDALAPQNSSPLTPETYGPPLPPGWTAPAGGGGDTVP